MVIFSNCKRDFGILHFYKYTAMYRMYEKCCQNLFMLIKHVELRKRVEKIFDFKV